MKVAICFYGLDPSETWKNIKIKEDKCLNLWKKNVFDINNCDIFIHSFSKKRKELLKYNPKDYLFEEEKNSEINFKEIQNFEKELNEKKNYNGWNLSNIKTQYYICYGIKKTIELMNKYETTNNFKYDLVLLSRIDVCWISPLNFNELNTNKIYSPIWGKNNIQGKLTNGLLGYWIMGNNNIIKKFSTFYDNLPYYFKKYKKCLSYHRLIKIHLSSVINNIDYKFKSIGCGEADMDLQRYIFK
tara:strand:+ start:46 stop:774 length:729 start_codon:yes stop_codon:yes gene_type:complete